MKEVNKDVVKFLKDQETVTLGFSTGKDSVCCATILKKLKVKFIPFYFYQCPDLTFVNQTIKMYEEIFEVHIIQLPHPMLYDRLRHQDFQTPAMIEYLQEYEIPKLTFEDLIYTYLESKNDYKLYYDVVGLRAAESFNRRKIFEKEGYFNHKKRKIFPIADWKKHDVIDYLNYNKIPLSNDYKIWDRSFDGLKYQFTIGLKKYYPEDYEKLLEYYPLLDLELFRYETNRKYFDANTK